jgi:hypothetical protein
MAYSTGSTIIDDDFNLFAKGVTTAGGADSSTVANANYIWKVTGAMPRGWGQSVTLSGVSAGNTVTATNWATLISRIQSIGNHTGTLLSAMTSPSTGNTISVVAALNTNLTNVWNAAGRNDAAASGADSSTTNSTTTTWSTSATLTKTFTWASADNFRSFFNAGGMIRLGLSRSGGSATPQNTGWTNLLTACGTLVLTGANTSKTIASVSYTGFTKIGGSGSPSVIETGIGAECLHNTGTRATLFTLFQQSDSTYLYTANFARLRYSLNATGTILTVEVFLSDAYAGATSVDGTLSASWAVRPPSTTYISNTWGTVTQSTPSWVLA